MTQHYSIINILTTILNKDGHKLLTISSIDQSIIIHLFWISFKASGTNNMTDNPLS